MHVRRSVKEFYHREDDMEVGVGLDTQVGPPKSSTSIRDIPLNDTAIEMIRLLQEEVYLGEDAPLMPDSNGDFTKPMNLFNRFKRLMKEAGVKRTKHKGRRALRHLLAGGGPPSVLRATSPAPRGKLFRDHTDQRNQAGGRLHQVPAHQSGRGYPRSHHH